MSKHLAESNANLFWNKPLSYKASDNSPSKFFKSKIKSKIMKFIKKVDVISHIQWKLLMKKHRLQTID